MKNLRLVLFENCNRSCPGCCNKDWDLRSLPVVESYKDYDIIMLTGGEPMLKPKLVIETAWEIRKQSDAKIYVYTAKINDVMATLAVLNFVDGLTVTLHEQSDLDPFLNLDSALGSIYCSDKSLRLNIFSGIEIPEYLHGNWLIKDNIKWIKKCPLPKDEVLMRLDYV
jgi:organic radical activating enzyme